MGERQTSLDLLRIFATIQVVIYHVSCSFGYDKPSKSNMFALLCVLGKTSNIHFMSISGYIGTSARFTFSKLIPLIIQTIFYSLFSYLAAIFFLQNARYSKWELVSMIFPIANSYYWYVLPFIVWDILFSLLYPTLSKLDTRHYKTVCFVFLIVHIYPWFGFYKYVGLHFHQSIGPFIVMGLFSSYFRYHYTEVSKSKLIPLYLVIYYYNFLVHQKPEYFETEWRLIFPFGDRRIMGLPSIILGLCSFYITISIKGQFKRHHLIQTIAQCSLGVFMYHYYPYGWRYWGKIAQDRCINYGPDYIFLFCYSVKLCIAGLLIEISRQYIFNVLIFKRKYYWLFTQYVDHFLMSKPLRK